MYRIRDQLPSGPKFNTGLEKKMNAQSSYQQALSMYFSAM